MKKSRNSLFLKICSFVALFLYTSFISGQVPNGLNYQAIVRDNAGKPISTRNVTFKFSILKGSTTGTLIYSEEQKVVTNEFGLANLYLGYGFPLQGKFDQIAWEQGGYFLKTELDPNGGSNFELSSVSPFLSVPYALYSEKTKLEAGNGIQIDGNKITNTGDPDPTDDLRSGSPVSGDLTGILPSPSVVAIQGRPVQNISPQNMQALVWNGNQWGPMTIDSDPGNDIIINSIAGGDLRGSFPNPIVQSIQGRPVMDIIPAAQQVLIWNGSQWVPGTVDLDPGNDIINGSSAGGDLIGTYPNPKVAKLNGFPISMSSPDSGDVLVFSQGEWKHLPASFGPGSSYWRKSGSDLLIDDPATIKRLNLNTTPVQTNSDILAVNNTDSSRIQASGLYQSKKEGTVKLTNIFNPGNLNLFANNNLVLGINTFTAGVPYSDIELWNYDPNERAVYTAMNPYGLGLKGTMPESDAILSVGNFDMFRKVRENPLEYSGLSLVDSSFTFYAKNKELFAAEANQVDGGAIYLNDKSGLDRIWISYLIGDPTQGYITVLSGKTKREAAALLSSNSAGELYLNNSSNQTTNVYAGYSVLGTQYPFLGIIGKDNTEHAGMYVDQFYDGYIFSDIKSFRMKDPTQSDREIWYACVEGPEAAAYIRGSGTLINGEAFIPYPDHFITVANTEKATIQLTPTTTTETYGVAVTEKRKNGFTVRELQKGKGNYSFDYEVKAVRQGKEHFQVYRQNTQLHNQEQVSGFKKTHDSESTFRPGNMRFNK